MRPQSCIWRTSWVPHPLRTVPTASAAALKNYKLCYCSQGLLC